MFIDNNVDNINDILSISHYKNADNIMPAGVFIKNEDPYFLVIRQFIAIKALANHTRINDVFLYDAHNGPINFFIAKG